MKKLLALLMVLGLTSLAGADLVFTVNGDPQPDELTLETSEEVTLDMHLAAGENILKYQVTYSLSNEQAEFLFPDPTDSTGLLTYGISFPWASMFPGKVNAYDQVGIISWVEIAADNFMAAVAGPLTLMDGLILHCLDDTPVAMSVTVSASTVIDGATVPVDTVLHTMDIIQIPEPMTIALLGLGGLLLRRRR